MKKTKLRRLLPLLLTLLTVIVCALGITVMADEEVTENRTSQITHVNVVIDNNVDLIFWTDISESTAQNVDTFMTFNDGTPTAYAGTKTLDGVTYALYRYNNVMPQDFGDTITAKLYVGSALTSTLTYSVKNYCQYLLTNSNSDSLKTLVSDLLTYGTETQALLGESVDEYVTNGMIGLKPSAAPSDMIVLQDNIPNQDLSREESASIDTSSLSMTNGVELYFNVDVPYTDTVLDNLTACLSINGREHETAVKSYGHYNKVTIKGIYTYELFDSAKISIYNGNTRVSNSMSFSLASYLNALSVDEKYTAVAQAYYNLGMSAHIYAGTHIVEMPGEIDVTGTGNVWYDSNGTLTYNCSLCGEKTDALQATHIRTFETPGANHNVANNANGGSLFTVETFSEELADGTNNNFLSFIRDESTDKGSGAFGYYFLPKQAMFGVIDQNINSNSEYVGDKFTFTFKVKAPEAGLGEVELVLRNTTQATGSGRYSNLLEISSNGAIKRGSTAISPAGTVNKDEWTDITVTIDKYTSNDTPYFFFEYFVNGSFVTSFSVVNTLRNAMFTDVYFSASTSTFSDQQGFLLDSMVFAIGCVHTFSGPVADYVAKLDNGNLRQVIDSIQNDFNLEQFSYVVRWDGKSTKTYKEYQSFYTMDSTTYQAPASTPKSYSHPRLLFNSSDIPAIVENIERPENAAAKERFLSQVATSTDGKLTPTSEITPKAFEYTNYDTGVLRAIEAKALYYALYKNDVSGNYSDAKLRGYQAIYAMKNYILTFDIQWKASDQCRYYGEVMYYAALVYDWCYDLLTDEDRDQFRLGVQNLVCDGTNNMPWAATEGGAIGSRNTHSGRKLEGGFPALQDEMQSSLTGHGAEAQVLRDYFSFSIAIYDEDPSWYNYVGGMIYQNYIDARNYFYTSGYYPDGAAGYNVYRFICDLYNAWLFKGMGVEFPYNEEDMASVIHGLVSMEINDNFMFATADGSGTSSYGQYRLNTTVGDAALISSYLFNDSAALAIAERLCAYEYNRYGFSHQLGVSCAYYLILTANDLVPSEDYREKISNVEYHGGFQQQVVSRNDKSDDSVVVLMQGAQHLPGGHTHQNAGNFQIWYKGMLTRDDGLYDAYGSDHHFYYHMSATAHNTLLIYNNNLKNTPVGPTNKMLYNGGQKYEIGIQHTDYTTWLEDSKFSFGKNIGMQTDDENNPTYVYFANDITNAYDIQTVDYVERSFMTLYTGDAETPMVMFVFDNITSDKKNYQKTFLLQCAEEPEIDYDNKTVTVDNGEGKLVLTSLLGADNIYAYGRTSTNGKVDTESYVNEKGEIVKISDERFYLSGQGKSVNPGGATSIGDSNSDLSVVWGHVEIQPEANQYTNQLMNVLYVSDSGTTVSATPTLVNGNYITGATFKNYTSVFVNDASHTSDLLTFTTEGAGDMTYYVGGLSAGTWKLSVNGEFRGEYNVTDEGKMLTFTDEVGTIVLEPGNDIKPIGTELLFYSLNGGKNPVDAPSYYYVGQTTKLPTPTKTDSIFEGWFLDKECTVPITEITPEHTGKIMLYAKWTSPIVYLDYSKGGSMSDFGSITYSPESVGSFKMVNGNDNYFLWSTSAYGSVLTKDDTYAKYADESLKVTFNLTFGRDGANPILPMVLYLRDGKSTVKYLNIFRLDANGDAYLGSIKAEHKFDHIASTGYTTLRFVLDFEAGRVYAYNENGEKTKDLSMAEIGVNLPAEYSTYEEWFRNLDAHGCSVISLKGEKAGTIRIANISVWAGDISGSCSSYGPNSTIHKWNNGEVVRESSSESCTPGAYRYTCAECGLEKEIAIVSEKSHSSLSVRQNGNESTYVCNDCGCVFTPAINYYLDGSSYNGIIGYGNANNYTTVEGSHQPLSGSGYYELLNKTDKKADMQLWIPSIAPSISGLSSMNEALGALSFRVNALTEENIGFYFVDTSSTGEKWSSDWCMTDAFFNISAPTEIDGKATVKVTGWNGMVLKTVAKNDFTGWFDVKVMMEFDPDEDTITLHYYIDGEYVGSATKELTIATNAINSICISGSTSKMGSGIMLDDIAFGFTGGGVWSFDD